MPLLSLFENLLIEEEMFQDVRRFDDFEDYL